MTHRSKSSLAAAVLAALLIPSGAHAELEGEDADLDRAARALFGEGVVRRADAGANTLTLELDPKQLTARQLSRYTAKYYNPISKEHAAGWSHEYGDVRIEPYHLPSLLRQGADSWILVEPYIRGRLCVEIAKKISDAERRQYLVDWCEIRAVFEARFNQFEFRGERVTWPLVSRYQGTLRVYSKAWPDDQPLLLISGKHRITDAVHLRAQTAIARLIQPRNRFYSKAQKVIADNKPELAKLQKLAEKRTRKHRAKKVVFAERAFDPLDVPEASRGKSHCGRTYWKAFAPRKSGYYEWQISVDGAMCESGSVGGGNEAATGALFTGRSDDCSKALVAEGEHRVQIEVFKTRFAKTGRIELRRSGDRLTAREQTTSSTGRRVARGATVCTSDDSLRRRYAKTNR